jgi:hypothetical protein
MDADADPTDKWGRPGLQGKSATDALCKSAGVETTACIEGMRGKPGKPTTTAVATATGSPRGSGPVASAAERPVVAMKPGNAGGAKGPQFKDQRTQEQGRG